MIVVGPVNDEARDREHADHRYGARSAPERNRDARQEDDRVNDGLEKRLLLSDRGDDENVDDQQDEEGAETPFAEPQTADAAT